MRQPGEITRVTGNMLEITFCRPEACATCNACEGGKREHVLWVQGEGQVGDIAVARDLVQHDVDTTAVGDPIGLVSTVNRVEFPCAAWAVEGLLNAISSLPGLRGREARIASGDQFISDAARKRFIAETFQGDVCEMEGCPIAQVCWINGVDCAVLRAISDKNPDKQPRKSIAFSSLSSINSSLLAST